MENNNKKQYSRHVVTKNVRILAVVLAVLTVVTTCRLCFVMFSDNTNYKQGAARSQWKTSTIEALRGNIYDADGNVLAQSAFVWRLYIIPANFRYSPYAQKEYEINENFKQQLCYDLSKIASIDYDELIEKASGKEQNDRVNRPKVVVKTQIELEEKNKIMELISSTDNHPKGYVYTETVSSADSDEVTKRNYYYSSVIGFETDVKRYYPYASFASNLIGLVEQDNQSVGQTGIEAYYNSDLAGIPGRKTSYGSKTDESSETIYEAKNGNNLYLTINETIQYALNEQLESVYKSSGGIGAYGIVQNVKTGAILAMDCVGYKGGFDLNNRYDLNDYYSRRLEKDSISDSTKYLTEDNVKELESVTDQTEKNELRRSLLSKNMQTSMWNNYCVSELYYPGSVFKVFLAAAAIEEKVLDDDFQYCCNGSIQIEDRTFHCHQASGHGWQTLTKGLMNSCNPFFITVGRKLGAEKFFEYFEAFGFTEKTGIDTLSEEGGSTSNYYTADRLGAVELASESFGQSFRVSPIQMITALSAIANGGKLLTPYIVAKETDCDGNIVFEAETKVRRQVVSEDTAKQVAEMMEQVVISGTGRNGYVAGYRVAGKTGTTQKENERGLYIASFGCFAPVDNPEIAVLIIVDEPTSEINGSTVCAPVAAHVVESSLEYLGVERQYTEKEEAALDTQAIGVIGNEIGIAKIMLEEKGFKVKVVGSGDTVVSQNPAGGQTIPQEGVVVLYTERDTDPITVTVPNFTGMTPSQAKKYAAGEGLNAKFFGSTSSNMVAYDQSIASGTETEYGNSITISFKTYTGVNDFAG